MIESTPNDNEQRLIQACSMLVARYVQQELPEGHRGPVSNDFVRKRAPRMVTSALNDVVRDLVNMVTGRTEDAAPVRAAAHSGRIRVLTNTHPCSNCGKVTRLANHTYELGALVRVECERCNPIERPA